ncbi:MAG: YdiU family protein [Pseudomonadota bacterium]
MRLANSYANLPGRFYAPIRPDPAPQPVLLAWNDELAAELGLQSIAGDGLAQLYSGTALPPGATPIALAYAGHQFGHFVPQLGDGRAVLLGEVVTDGGRRYDIQLKGSGRTPFSRGGDGRSWLGPVLREYLVSEAMHSLGVPTTRALAAVATGATVYREAALPGAVFTRVAASHLRVGTFEFFAARHDVDALTTLLDYAIERHYPDAAGAGQPCVAFLEAVMRRQAALIAGWMSVGFVHGVINTDNTSIAGETLDYGPCAFLDEFSFDKVFSSIDRHGRYAYGNQPAIAVWNLARLADCLRLIDDAQPEFEAVLNGFDREYRRCYLDRMRPKLGLVVAGTDDADLVDAWLRHLDANDLDYTRSFRRLAARLSADEAGEFGEFELRWRQRLRRQAAGDDAIVATMNSANPVFIPRNHRIEEAIRAAVDGDLAPFRTLHEVLTTPFDEQPEHRALAEPPQPHERVTQTFCGT